MASINSRPCMASLPVELILSILEYGYYKADGFPDKTFFISCSLVCSSWSLPAQMLLFRSATKLRAHNTPAFGAAIDPSTERGRMLGSSVRVLEVSVGRSMNESCGEREFAKILNACPRLYELILSTYGLHEFEKSVMDELRQGSKLGCGTGIRALNLMYCGVQSPIVYQLLSLWPSIQFLKIGTEISASPPGWDGIAAFNHSHPVNAEESSEGSRKGADVHIYDLVLSRTLSPQVLDWLLSASTTSLRIVDLRDIPGPGMRNALAKFGSHLRSLRLMHFSADSAALVRMCTSLEELAVYHVPTVVPLIGLPETIEHFSFRNPIHNYRDTLRPIVDAVRTLPRLRVLTCDRNSEQLPEFEELRALCDDRGVEVRVETMPFWVHEDPVIANRFPRRKSVSNFRLMV